MMETFGRQEYEWIRVLKNALVCDAMVQARGREGGVLLLVPLHINSASKDYGEMS